MMVIGVLAHSHDAAPPIGQPNVRRSVLDDAAFEKLLAAAESQLNPIILVAYDTGMRLREVLGLRWWQVNLKLGVIELSAEDTKTEKPRTVFLTSRVREALEAQPRHIKSDRVFINPDTEEAWKDIRKVFRRACKAVKRIEAGTAKSSGASGQDLDKVKGG